MPSKTTTLEDLVGGTILLARKTGNGEVGIVIALGSAQHMLLLRAANNRRGPCVLYEIATDADTLIASQESPNT